MKNYPIIISSLLASTVSLAQKKDIRDFNVVFIISDQHKASVMGCVGDPVVQTPNLDELARTGVLFTKIYCASPLSAPSRAALITGTYPSTNGVLLHRMTFVNKNGVSQATEAGKHRVGYAENLKTWGAFFQENKYGTAAIGKMHVHGELQKGVNPEYPDGNLMGFDVSDMRFYTYFPGGHYRDWKNNPDYYNRYREIAEYQSKTSWLNEQFQPSLLENEEDVMDIIVADKSNAYIAEKVKNKQRFVIHVGFEKPHKPWTTLPKYQSLYRPEDMILPETYQDGHKNGKYPYVKDGQYVKLTDTVDIKRSMAAYYACVSEVDDVVGRIVRQTKDLGIFDQTIFIYTSDHGEHLYEHGLTEKHNMFEDAVNVPFILSCPALFPQGITCESLGSLIDVLPTLADILGLQPEKQWEGKSLLSQIGVETTWNRQVFSELYPENFLAFPQKNMPTRMLLDKKYKYSYAHGVIDQFYDVGDKNEMNNLAFGTKYADLIQKYRLMTLAGWKFSLLPQMTGIITVKSGLVHLSWSALKEARSYTVWKSETGKVEDAQPLTEISGTEYTDREVKSETVYWITANWQFVRKGDRKEKIPMITETYPENLPITPTLIVRQANKQVKTRIK
jgi:arylsulfatase A-like enzyme